MIDLNYRKPQPREEAEPEEIFLMIVTIILWACIAFGIGAAL